MEWQFCCESSALSLYGVPVLSCASNATAKSLWERVERLLDYLTEMFTLHPSSIKTNKGTLTPSSRRRLLRHHRHFLCRRLRLPLRLLPRRAVVERGHRQTDQKGLSRGILDVFCSCRMVKIFDRFEKARLAASTSLLGLPSSPPR